MDNFDDTILDNVTIDEDCHNTSQNSTQNSKTNKTRSTDRPNRVKYSTQSSSQRNKKAKRLPWNTEVLRDRFTPQPFQVQLVNECTSFNNENEYNNKRQNFLIFMRSDEYKNYLELMIIKQYTLNLNLHERKLMVLVTSMSSEVASYVELISKHTTLKIAGIDHNLMTSHSSEAADDYCMKIKDEAQIVIISIDILIDWFRRSLLIANELLLIIFTDASAAYHNQSYKLLMDSYFSPNSTTNIISFGVLSISSKTTHIHVKKQIEYLKQIFHAEHVETATDLIDSYNLFNGIEPLEFIQICENVDLVNRETSNQFQICLLDMIKKTYTFMDDIHTSFGKVPNEENVSYIHSLCVRVLNECVYLLNEVGIWCLAKSLLPIICQLDKISTYIVNSNKVKAVKEEDSKGNITVLTDPDQLQELVLQYTSTSLRSLRETCIGQFLQEKMNSKKVENRQSSIKIDYFLENFCTPKVKSLVELLRTYKKTADEFCCLIFVQNKQVATSLSLLLKKLAKEDLTLNYLYPNYVISPGTNQSAPSDYNSTETVENLTDTASDSLKQEEILRKFYSGDINLLICTYEMEKHITAPTCINLIVRFNCNITNEAQDKMINNASVVSFDYFSYINTKSRSQYKTASCYFFIERANFDSFFHEFIRCKQIEQTLIKSYSKLLNQSLNANTVSADGHEKLLSLESAIRFINKYCIRLPSDALTQLTPRNIIITRNGNGTTLFKCLIYLPINSGIHESIEGSWQPSEISAKRVASYKACIFLLNKKELTDMLEPVTKELFYRLNHKSDSDDEREWSQFSNYFHKHQQQIGRNGVSQNIQQQIANYMSHRPGGNKRKQVYTKKVSPYLGSMQLITYQNPVYLYVFDCSITTPIPNLNTSSKPSLTTECSFGLVASKVLLETSDFPIFTQNGEETVSCRLVKSGVYLTQNQLKLIKSFHKFLFSNILRLEGFGACALPYLTENDKKSTQNNGCYISILSGSNMNYDFNWDLMKKVENCTDRKFLRVPEFTKFISENNQNEEESESAENEPKVEKPVFKFREIDFSDSVVIPFYRNNDALPQFYSVASIDYTLNPLSPFPISTVKYDILITDLTQPMLVVSHPSTRLNLLTPRYMNMKASVIQRTFHQPHQRCGVNHQSVESRKSSSKIFLVPELVNIHPFTASVLRKSMCLPSILYRLNSLLVVEELRREIAQSTGAGLPWYSDAHRFERLSFEWDKNKEIEISDMPDVEIDIASIKHQKKLDDEQTSQAAIDSKWNFEISEWNDDILKESLNKEKKKKDIFKNKANNIFEFNYESSNLKNMINANESGWNDDNIGQNGNPKTLFIDPNDMEFFEDVDEFSDSDEEFLYKPEKPNEMLNKSNEKESMNKSFSENSESDNELAENESNIKYQFTIDINKLNADMKKKSAKLLSKLSVNSNDCSLVKDLVASEFDENKQGVNAEKVETLNFDATLAMNSNPKLIENIISSKESVFLNGIASESNEISERVDVNEWFDRVQIKVDLNASNENALMSENVVDNIRKKLGLITKLSTEENNKILPPIYHNESSYQQIKLPLAEEEQNNFISNEPSPTKNSLITKSLTSGEVSTGSTATILRNTDWSFDFQLDDLEKDNQIGPGPELLLQALTLANAADGFDLERLETVGDSFLKQAVTVFLFFAYPSVHEGKLSYLRSKQVSNYNLYKLGRRKGLQELMVANKFEPLDSWLPPHYDSLNSINLGKNKITTSASAMLSSLLNKKEAATVESQAAPNQFDKYKEHIISDKAIADSVEAIIGAYLIISGPKAALQIMSWFGLKVLPRVKCEDGSEILMNVPQIPRPVINDPLKLSQLLDGYASFEACIGYKFKEPAYLLQAFTHASYVYNTLTDCYQRLEFLGDAILDYVITRHLYEDKKRHSPGELTDLRSALVNNNIFAHLAVKYDYYKYFKYLSPALFTIIDNFVSHQKKRNDEFDLDEDFFDYPIDDDDEEEFNLMNDSDNTDDNHDDPLVKADTKKSHHHHHKPFLGTGQLNELEEMEVPKCLGDIFESVAGAIFLDSNKSFDAVWKVYYGLMKPHIDRFTTTVPKSPIRELFELEPETAKFEKPERTIDGKIRVTVSIFGRGKFKGVGRNYRIAKNAAAKLALKCLKNNEF